MELARRSPRSFDTGIVIDKDTPGYMELPVHPDKMHLFSECDGMQDARPLRIHTAGETNSAGKMNCQRCGLQLLPPVSLAAVIKRTVRLRGCYKVFFKQSAQGYFGACMVAAKSPAEAQGIVERAYPGAMVESCFSQSTDEQAEIIAEL